MSEFREVDDHKLGQYALDSMDADELASACRRLGIAGPLEPLLRDLKEKSEKYVPPSSPASLDSSRRISHRRERRPEKGNGENMLVAGGRGGPAKNERFFVASGDDGAIVGYGQNSYGKESKDSGIRDLSPEPNPHRRCPTEQTDIQKMESEPGGTSAMLQLASKVSVLSG